MTKLRDQKWSDLVSSNDMSGLMLKVDGPKNQPQPAGVIVDAKMEDGRVVIIYCINNAEEVLSFVPYGPIYYGSKGFMGHMDDGRRVNLSYNLPRRVAS